VSRSAAPANFQQHTGRSDCRFRYLPTPLVVVGVATDTNLTGHAVNSPIVQRRLSLSTDALVGYTV
jgi:hypothetical protein